MDKFDEVHVNIHSSNSRIIIIEIWAAFKGSLGYTLGWYCPLSPSPPPQKKKNFFAILSVCTKETGSELYLSLSL